MDLTSSVTVRIELKVIITQIRSLADSITKLEKEISECGSQLEGHANLKSIKGIGDYSAAVLLSEIGDINDFPDADKLASYFGIVPHVSNFNQTQQHGSITNEARN